MRVAILTMFNGLTTTYSIVNVVAEHLRMLLEAGIEVKVLVSEDCPDRDRFGVFLDERIEWIKVVNRFNGQQIHWKDYSQAVGKVHETFFDEADVIAEDFVKHLQDVDVCMMHDIHYQGWHLLHNVAIRKAQEKLPDLRFIAITHSAPVARPKITKWPFSARFSPMPRTTYVYPTLSGLPALSEQYDVAQGKCRVINNTLDTLGMLSEHIQQLASKIDLLSPEILIVYPGRLTPAKKFDKVAAFAGAMQRVTSKKVSVIFCDFPSLDVSPEKYKEKVCSEGIKFGLSKECIAFTSDLGYPDGFPRSAVLELFTLSNLFICPSFSESFGLTVLEAASRGNFIVLNEAVPALLELGKELQAYFMRWDARNFGFDTKETYHPSEMAYYEEHASIILEKMEQNPVLIAKTKSRTRYSPAWVWKHQLEPLIYE